MGRRVAVHGADDHLHLTADALCIFRSVAHDRHGTDALAIKTHVLGITLAKDQLKPRIHEQTHSRSILVQVPTGKTLVGAIEQRQQVLLLNNLEYGLPLLRLGVNSRGVVSASMKKHDAPVRCSLEVSAHTLKVKTTSFWIIVTVTHNWDASVGEDLFVVAPSRIRQKYCCVLVESCKELPGNTKSA